MGSRSQLTGIGKDFLNITLVAQAIRSTTDKWNLLKLKKKKKGLPCSKETVTPVKRQPAEWRRDCGPAIHLMVDKCLEYTMNIKKTHPIKNDKQIRLQRNTDG